jgi:hypothetical protein
VFGSQSIVIYAKELKSLYEQKCKETVTTHLNFDSMDMNIAIFESVAKALKVNL